MKKLAMFLFVCAILSFSYDSFAYRRGGYSHGYRHSYSRSHVRSYGGVHTVRTYTRRNGTIVRQHLAGNPRSGIHCHHNICR